MRLDKERVEECEKRSASGVRVERSASREREGREGVRVEKECK